jgi:glycolate oxidase subunit GlcD
VETTPLKSSNESNLKPALPAHLIAELKALLPGDGIQTDSSTLATYGRDWTKHYDIRPGAIAFPDSTEQVVSLVQWARKNRVGLIPSGGRTGLSGGAIALNGELVVSLDRMNQILDFNPIDRTVRVQAGVVTEALQQYVRDQGFLFPVDFAARGSSQIGGNIATNAGGIKVLRYGNTREWVASLKVVTGTGEVLEFNRSLVKNATGFDFRHLFIGSEGTLGLITEATLRVATPTQPLTVLVLGVPDLESVMEVFRAFRDQVPLTAFEFFSDIALDIVTEHAHLQKPFGTEAPNYLVVEVENTDASVEEKVLTIFESCVEKGWVIDGSIAQSETQARDFWRLREDISEATAPYMPYKNDVSVTISKVPEFLRETDAVLKANYPDFRVVWFGHIGDGNMHINILKPEALSRDEFLNKCKGASQLLFQVIAKMGGSISAEHGVGLTKKPFLGFTRTPVEIELMKGVKRVFDPDGIMNPGKIFD